MAGDGEAVAEVRVHGRGADRAAFPLEDARQVLARSYGFAGWAKLQAYADGATVRRLADAVQANDIEQVRAMLEARPELAGLALGYRDERRPIHFAVMARLPELVRLLLRHGASARTGIYPHRAATTAWTLAEERGYSEIVAILEEEEQRQPQTEDEDAAGEEPLGDAAARRAVAVGDAEWLRTQHQAGSLTNPVRWGEGGLLTLAVRENQPHILRLLLDCGFHPDEPVSQGNGDWVAHSAGHPLWHCAALGHTEMATLLLERGADPNAHVDSSGSAVYSAYSHRQWELADLLRRHGGVVSAGIAAVYRMTGLAREMLAADGGEAVAEELLRFGACGGDPEIVRLALERIPWAADDARWFGCLTEPLCFWHHIPWLYAGNKEFDRGSYLPCFHLILARCGAHHSGSFGRTALHEVAAMGGWISDAEAAPFARALLEAGARLDARDSILESTALGWACRWGRLDIVRLLLAAGADPLEADVAPWARPRAWAEKRGHTAVVALLDDALRDATGNPPPPAVR